MADGPVALQRHREGQVGRAHPPDVEQPEEDGEAGVCDGGGEPRAELGQSEHDERAEEEQGVTDGQAGQQGGEGLADGGLDQHRDAH